MNKVIALRKSAPVDPLGYVTIGPDARRSIDAMASTARQIALTASGSFTTEAKAEALRTLLGEVERLAKAARGAL